MIITAVSNSRALSYSLLIILLMVVAGDLSANKDIAVPDQLKPWQGWVLHDIEDNDCPFLYKTINSVFVPGPQY